MECHDNLLQAAVDFKQLRDDAKALNRKSDLLKPLGRRIKGLVTLLLAQVFPELKDPPILDV